jgi:hypothetical protein
LSTIVVLVATAILLLDKQGKNYSWGPKTLYGTVGTGTDTFVLCPRLFLSGDFVKKEISKNQIKS